MVMPAREYQRMSYEEYLVLERDSETKHEYVNGEVYAMVGGTPEHARLQARFGHLLSVALAGRSCEPFSSDLRVRIEATGRSTYPDITVVCDRIERARDDADAVINPAALVEVLSDTSERDDRGDKWAHYQRIPSLKHYVLVSQKEARVEIYSRESTGWHYEDVRLGGRVVLKALEVSFDVDALYARALETIPERG
jgi:Uma2 family endonuclease